MQASDNQHRAMILNRREPDESNPIFTLAFSLRENNGIEKQSPSRESGNLTRMRQLKLMFGAAKVAGF